MNAKIQATLEHVIIITIVAMVAIIVGFVVYMKTTSGTTIGKQTSLLSIGETPSNTIILALSNKLPLGITPIDLKTNDGLIPLISISNTPNYVDNYPEYVVEIKGTAIPIGAIVYSFDYNYDGKQYSIIPATNNTAIQFITGNVVPIGSSQPSSQPSSQSSSQPSSQPSSLVYITITNSQTSSTPAPFQQLIELPESDVPGIQYNGKIANFEFETSSGSVVPAWIESNQSGTLYIWVKLQNGIPASSNTILYVVTKQGQNLLSASGTTGIGEAPQLSPIYAEYDDGASVFNYYTNFAGTSLPSGWYSYGPNWNDYSVNDGLTVGSTSTFGGTNIGVAYASPVPSPMIVDALVTSDAISGGSPSAGLMEFDTLSYGNDGFENGYSFSGGGLFTSRTQIEAYDSGGNNAYVASGGGISIPGVISLLWQSTGNIICYANYNNVISSTNTENIMNPQYYFGVYDSGGAFQHQTTYQWIRTRAVPPNDVMPSVTIS